ncbi:aldolase [Neobacillus mesonae]|uniref:aldolase n=1 Tax=Neobacillus mesonae TaxID=1193713 RepID=UPI00203B2848|nr:aldolase [Neobacillus mesonae]MCM3568202.1 aldolase [Neobacillus mesonae]
MIRVSQRVFYKAFGLNIVSDIIFPELDIVKGKLDNVDVTLQIKDLSKEWDELLFDNETFRVKEDLVLFKILETAIFCIKNGNEILVSPMNGADLDKIRLYILGTCMGALLIQKKIIPLHGSAIEIEGKAYAIIGESGAGKSTLASAFINKGYKLLSDDVIAVTLSKNHVPIVTPSYPQQKLWKESLNEFGMDSSQFRPIIERETKFAIPVLENFNSEPVPLAGIIELIKSENDELNYRRINGMERLQTLFAHTYRNFLIELLDLMEWHFTSSAKIIDQIDFFQLQRPISTFTANHLVSLILESITKENVEC